MAKRIPTPGRPIIKKTVTTNSSRRTNTGIIANPKAKGTGSSVAKTAINKKLSRGSSSAERTIMPIGKKFNMGGSTPKKKIPMPPTKQKAKPFKRPSSSMNR